MIRPQEERDYEEQSITPLTLNEIGDEIGMANLPLVEKYAAQAVAEARVAMLEELRTRAKNYDNGTEYPFDPEDVSLSDAREIAAETLRDVIDFFTTRSATYDYHTTLAHCEVEITKRLSTVIATSRDSIIEEIRAEIKKRGGGDVCNIDGHFSDADADTCNPSDYEAITAFARCLDIVRATLVTKDN